MWKTCERENLAFFAGELAESGVIIKRPETKKVQKDHQLRSWIIMQSDDRKKKKNMKKLINYYDVKSKFFFVINIKFINNICS